MRTTIGPNETQGFVFDAESENQRLTPVRLFGLPLDNASAPGHRSGLAALFTSRGRFDSRAWAVAANKNSVTFTWEDSGLRWVSCWEFDDAILVRKDFLTNTGDDAVRIHRAQARLTFAPVSYTHLTLPTNREV